MNTDNKIRAFLIVLMIMTAAAVAITLLNPAKAETRQETKQEAQLTHAQEVWIAALEWCESRGRPEAINKKDRDGTPSYYSFQFKPSTLEYYGKIYKVIPQEADEAQLAEYLKSYEIQYAIVKAMVLDSKHITWEQQFPGCVKKNGPPPTY